MLKVIILKTSESAKTLRVVTIYFYCRILIGRKIVKKYKITIISILIFLFGMTAGYCVETFLTAKNTQIIDNTSTEVASVEPVKVTSDKKEVQKPSVLLFHSKHCSSCDKIRPIWKALEKEYKKEFNFYEIDVDQQQNARLCIEFLITTIPSIYIEDVPFRNRAYINPVMYSYLPRFSDELSRYLEMRKILKKGLEPEI